MNISIFILSIVIGFLLGISSGLIPGIHTNTFAFMLAAFAPWFSEIGFPPLSIAVIIVSNSITHTFVSIIPSVFLGAPDAETSLAVLPGHQMLLDGFGHEAVRLSALGSAGSVIVSLILILPMTFLFTCFYQLVDQFIGWILLVIVSIMIFTEKGDRRQRQISLLRLKYWTAALALFLISGMLGQLALGSEALMNPLIRLGEPSILMPLFSGLFGASMLVISMLTDTVIPIQTSSPSVLAPRRILRGMIMGSTAGSFVAWLPGITAAVATVMAGLGVKEDYSDEDSAREFIISISGVNTSNAIFGLIALYIISRTRSGAMVAISDVLNGKSLDMNILFILFMAIFSVSIAAYFITILLGDWILPLLTRINYHLLCMSVLTGLTILIFLFTGWFGLVVYGAAVPIGMLAPYLKVRRTHAMGVLLLPLLIYYFNI